MQGDSFGLARRQVNAIERNQSTHRELHTSRNLVRCSEINLRDLVAFHAARVLDLAPNVQTAVGSLVNLQAGVSKSGVTQAVAEGKQRVDLFLVEPAVTHVDAFAISGLAVHPLVRPLWMFGIGSSIILKSLRPGDRQTPCRAGLAGKQVGRGPAALVARPPHFEDALDL